MAMLPRALSYLIAGLAGMGAAMLTLTLLEASYGCYDRGDRSTACIILVVYILAMVVFGASLWAILTHPLSLVRGSPPLPLACSFAGGFLFGVYQYLK